jgi:hypothetical protein
VDIASEFRRFIAPGAERLVCLAGMLAARGLGYTVLRTGEARHLAVRLGTDAPRLILAAHYDRVEGSPGVLDNSCACLELVDFAGRQKARGREAPILIVFTDGEEAPGKGSAADQGSLGLAKGIRAACAGKGEAPPVLVLDVTGRGTSLLLSSAPADLLARQGLASSPQAQGHAFLKDLVSRCAARASLPGPRQAALPWSDDLGLVLGGLGALTLSLLPEAEAALLLSGGSPPTWALLHGPGDSIEAADPGAFAVMAKLLDGLGDIIHGRPPVPEKRLI